VPNIISKEEVERMAKLARLSLSKQEVKQATKDIAGILEHFSALEEVKTEGVEEALDMSEKKNVVRADEASVEQLCTSKDLLELAPETKDGQVKVKAVF